MEGLSTNRRPFSARTASVPDLDLDRLRRIAAGWATENPKAQVHPTWEGLGSYSSIVDEGMSALGPLLEQIAVLSEAVVRALDELLQAPVDEAYLSGLLPELFRAAAGWRGESA